MADTVYIDLENTSNVLLTFDLNGGTFVPGATAEAFTSPVAQLRLVPASASTHHSSGVAGDLFVDSGNRLWFCQGASTRKQVSLV